MNRTLKGAILGSLATTAVFLGVAACAPAADDDGDDCESQGTYNISEVFTETLQIKSPAPVQTGQPWDAWDAIIKAGE